MTNSLPPAQGRILSRSTYLALLQTALSVRQNHFARQAALAWLAVYPGDLGVGLCYGRALLALGQIEQALPVLDGLCRADPLWEEAAQVFWQASQALFGPGMLASGLPKDIGGISPGILQAVLFVLAGSSKGAGPAFTRPSLPTWAVELRQARLALQAGDSTAAAAFTRQALAADPPTSLAAVTHLQFLACNPVIPQPVRRKLAERYYQRWPDNLICMLYLADWMMESPDEGDSAASGRPDADGSGTGDASRAVALLHQAAARDVAGQVVRRLWGDKAPYLPLWPAHLECELKLPIPAEVSAVLGWNRLTASNPVITPPTAAVSFTPGAVPPAVEPAVEPVQAVNPAGTTLIPSAGPTEKSLEAALKQPTTMIDEGDLDAWLSKSPLKGPGQPDPSPEVDAAGPALPGNVAVLPPPAQAEALRSLKQELERLAEQMHLPGLARLDGRFPMYIIFSVRSRLVTVYGQSTVSVLEVEMQRLARAVQGRRGWGACLFFADDPACTAAFGVKPARPGDAWALKRSLAELDAALARRGQMIGAVLIVGGPEIVPFHKLPNPVDDPDVEVPSDNPYATRDQNYFIPEWPVGRLLAGAGSDASLLIQSLQRSAAQHTDRARRGVPAPWYRRWLGWLGDFAAGNFAEFLQAIFPVSIFSAVASRDWNSAAKLGSLSRSRNYGYTAAVWHQAASAVFQAIGEPGALHSSPPCSADGPPVQTGIPVHPIPAPAGRLAYFNLHGLAEAPEWYGQRDPLSPAVGPDYPVALRPGDIQADERRAGEFPQVVFSEACYGLNVAGKPIDQSISLKFLQAGAQAVAGSTCMSYGTVGEPLMAADLLGQTFWKHIRSGYPAGEALRLAKIILAGSMHQRQGYLDGEDQKTLISFILFGDPLAQPVEPRSGAKAGFFADKVRRSLSARRAPLTLCDRGGCPLTGGIDAETQPVPDEVLQSVRQVVARYLPGMDEAQMKVVRPRPHCTARVGGGGADQPDAPTGQSCCQSSAAKLPAAKLPKEIEPGESSAGRSPDQTRPVRPTNRLVTLSKQAPAEKGAHWVVARLTLDSQGKLLKLVVSR